MKKILTVFLCFSLLFTAVSCTLIPQKPQIATPEATQIHQDPQEPDGIYDDIIAQYTDLLTAKHNGEELTAPNTEGMDEVESSIANTLYGIVNSRQDAKTVENLGYGYKDMDGNGVPELILLTKYTSILAIFTISNEKPILLEANYGENSSFVFARRNRFLMTRGAIADNVEEYTFYTCHVDGDQMVYDSVFGEVYDREKQELVEHFRMVDGERILIDRESFEALNWEHVQVPRPGYNSISKLIAPLIHLPLADPLIPEDLPVVDFSDYAAIRETYKAISTCLNKFNSFAWHTGEYDRLFAFPNEIAFEYYNRLLYAAYHSHSNVGYDEIDLNGDGVDELVLMNEDYNIKAIFTQKNGSPVLVDAFTPETTCWLDDRGFIHVDREDYNELEYSLYEFAKNGDYDLVYSVLVAENYNRYLTKNGKTEQITYEESMKIYYDDYCRYSEPFQPNEQTRNVSQLTYTPLTEPIKDLVKDASEKTWIKSASLEKTSGKDLAYSNTYVSFENVTDLQVNVNFKYSFTFYYPDPDRENWLLDDTTESSLSITAHAANGVFAFNESGVKGRLEFGQNYLWIIIEESVDQRFPTGFHCYEIYDPNKYI